MDKRLTTIVEPGTEKKLPIWDCTLNQNTKEPSTVGEIKELTCRGVDFVEAGKNYKLILDEKYENSLKILETKDDSASYKVFNVTSYKPTKGPLVVKFEKDGTLSFMSTIKGINVESVAKTPQEKKIDKPIPPLMGFYVLPGTVEILLILALFFSIFGLFIFKLFKKIKRQKEFKRVISKSKYTDPFMDFNIEMRNFSGQKKKSAIFLMQFDESLKKVLYRVFNETVSLQNTPLLVKKLKGLGLQAHEIRSFYVLEEEYSKFKKNYKLETINFYDFKNSFIDQTKKTINNLKRYSFEGEK